MTQRFEVIGDVMGDGYGGIEDDDGVQGDVMGYGSGVQVVGYDDNGDAIVVGKGRRNRRRPMVQLTKPQWRESQLAPGVIAPDQGLLPLPMGSFTFALAAQTNTFQGQIQKPFRGERLLVSTVRTGTTAVGRLMGQIFVGSDLAALDVPAVDLEQIGSPQAFGVRLTMKPAQPGVFIRIVTSLSSALTTTDTIFCTITLLGRLVH
jgi:hypothetical protein